MKRPVRQRKAVTALVLVGIVGGMAGLSFASVPLYRLFCQVTGYGGTPNLNAEARPDPIERRITVRFDANVNSALPWHFKPEQREMTVRFGEEGLAHYAATNLADAPVTGTAVFSVSPYKAAQYFTKIECFCFTEQRLGPGETVSMPVLFYVDPALLDDPDASDVTVMTLSYTFYPADEDDAGDPASLVRAGRGRANDG